MSTLHMFDPHREAAEAIRLAVGFLLAVVTGTLAWAVVIGLVVGVLYGLGVVR